MQNTDDIHFGAIFRVSIEEELSDPQMTKERAIQHLRRHLADIITRRKVETKREEGFVEYRLDIYVASPETFWGTIRDEAQNLTIRFKGAE